MLNTTTFALEKLDAIIGQLPYLPRDRKSVQLAKVLCWLARESESETVHVLHKQLTHYIGGTREQVTLFLGIFRNKGLITTTRGAGITVNVDALGKWISTQGKVRR